MKLAFSQLTASADEASFLMSRFHEFGYDGLQLKGGQYSPYLDAAGCFVETWGQVPGVASALIAGGRLDEGGLAQLRRVFAFGQEVGAERIVFCHTQPREGLTDDDIRGFARQLSDLGSEAGEAGLKLSLHNHNNSPVMHRRDFDTFFGAVVGGAVGLTLDTAHAALSGIEDIPSLIRDMRDVIDNFHMKDLAGGRFEVLGGGTLDFEGIFAAVVEIGYDGWVSADEESGADPAQAMKQCHE
ncbi:MAG: sugar phosphate isomerase/epimerase family protein, partial [Planctomycetota bacterium]